MIDFLYKAVSMFAGRGDYNYDEIYDEEDRSGYLKHLFIDRKFIDDKEVVFTFSHSNKFTDEDVYDFLLDSVDALEEYLEFCFQKEQQEGSKESLKKSFRLIKGSKP